MKKLNFLPVYWILLLKNMEFKKYFNRLLYNGYGPRAFWGPRGLL